MNQRYKETVLLSVALLHSNYWIIKAHHWRQAEGKTIICKVLHNGADEQAVVFEGNVQELAKKFWITSK